MSEFETKKLSDVVELVIDNRGRNPKSYKSEGIPVIDNYLITNDGDARLSDVKRYIDDETYGSFLRKYIQEGDVLMTLVGNGYGKVATTPTGKCAIIQNTIGFRCNENNDNQFLYYLLKNNRETLMNLNRGAAQPSIKVGDILDLEFQFPPIEKQQRVSSVLRSVDKKIELNRQTNQTLEHIAQAIFKSWFVDFEPTRAKIAAKQNGQDPERAAMAAISGKSLEALDQLEVQGRTNAAGAGSAGAASQEQQQQLKAIAALFPDALVDSELGEIPEGWEVKLLSGVIEVIGGGTPKRSEELYWNGDIPWFSVKDAPSHSDVFVIDTIEKISELGLQKSSTKLLSVGTTIITARGTVGKLALVGVPMCINQSCYGVKGIEGLGPYFNYYNLREAISTLQQNTHGAVFDTITTQTFESYSMAICIGELTKKYEEIVTPLLERIKNNGREISTLCAIRDTLLPKLLSGELAVGEVA